GWDCCGCYSCGACFANTSMSAAGGIGTFDSGPLESGGNNHQQDGFAATSAMVTVVPGRLHRVEINVANLDAHIMGDTGPETSPTYYPTWTLEVHDGATVAASIQHTWASAQCRTCSPSPAALGVQSATF